MNIFLTLKCGPNDSYFFIQQIAGPIVVDRVFVFRDTATIPISKASYITKAIPSLGKINLLLRIFQMLGYWRIKPSVIVGIYEIPHGLIAVLVAKLLHKPAIVSIIGNPAYDKLRKGFRMKLTMWILKRASYVTVTGNQSRQFLIKKGLAANKVKVLPNTMDFTGYNAVVYEKEYDIVSLGRISNEKRVDIIIRIVYELKKTNPEILSVIGGNGPDLPKLQNLIKELQLEQNIELKGFIPDEDLVGFFSKGKVFVLTSETEGFPRTIIQAAACNIPVVASDVGDIRDVIDHGINGYIVDDNRDIEQYVNYILSLLKTPSLANDFAEKLNSKVRREFATEKAAEVWSMVFNELNSKKEIIQEI